MANILYISASIRGEESVSRSLGDKLVSGLATKTGASVVTRDLSANDIPFVDAARFEANLTPADDRTPEQAQLAAISDTLIEELKAADTIVFSAPVYNFGAPAVVKAWADMVARAGTTFKYTETGAVGLLEGKRAYIAAASGGTPIGSDADFMTRWLAFFLRFLGIADVEVVGAAGTMGPAADAQIAAAEAKVAELVA